MGFLKTIIGWYPGTLTKVVDCPFPAVFATLDEVTSRKQQKERRTENRYSPSLMGSCPKWAEVREGGHRILQKKES